MAPRLGYLLPTRERIMSGEPPASATRKLSMAETVTEILRVLTQGSSFPSLVATTAGAERIMKLAGAGPGRRALATEYVALDLARRAGLNVPAATVLVLPPDLPWQVGTDEFYEAVQRSAGLNLGVALVADATDLPAAGLAGLPDAFLDRLAAVDALLQNVDRTSANPNIVRDGAGVPWAIDFGACLLLERLARGALQPRLDLPANHALAGRPEVAAYVRNLARAIDAADLGRLAGELPAPWLEDLGLSAATLADRLTRYVEGVRGG